MDKYLNTSYQTSALSASRNKVLRNTYLLLALTMIPTIVGALMGINMSFGFMRASPIVSSVVMLAAIYGMFFLIEKNRDSGLGVALLLALTFMLGVLLGPLLQVALSLRNGGQLITLAAGGTAVVFFAMATLSTVIKRDLGFLNKFMVVGGIVLMVAVVANIFMQIPALQLTICAGFILFSSAMILFQLKQIIEGGETNYVSATLTLYMGIYNIFTSLLQILLAVTGQSRD